MWTKRFVAKLQPEPRSQTFVGVLWQVPHRLALVFCLSIKRGSADSHLKLIEIFPSVRWNFLLGLKEYFVLIDILNNLKVDSKLTPS